MSEAGAARTTWLVRHPAEWRQIGIVAVYWSIMATGYFAPATRGLPLFAAACYFSFLNAVVVHNHMHRGIFHSKRLNAAWRCVLSFGNFYPASANVPGHNLVHHHFADDGQPDWAKRMKRGQSLSHGATLAAHAVRSGDGHGGGSSVNLSESDRS